MGIHPFNSPLPKIQNKKEILKFLKQFRLLSEKRKGIHQLTTSIRFQLFREPSPKFFFRYATEKLRILVTLSKTSQARFPSKGGQVDNAMAKPARNATSRQTGD